MGAVIGSTSFKEEYVNSKVSIWCNELERQTELNCKIPTTCCILFFCSWLQAQIYILHDNFPNAAYLFQPVEDIISTKLIPTIFGQGISLLDRQIFGIPTRDGGLGIPCIPNEADF